MAASSSANVELKRVFAFNDDDMRDCLKKYAFDNMKGKVMFYAGSHVSMAQYRHAKLIVSATNSCHKSKHEVLPAFKLAPLPSTDRILVSSPLLAHRLTEADGDDVERVRVEWSEDIPHIVERWPQQPRPTAIIAKEVHEITRGEIIKLLGASGIKHEVEDELKFGTRVLTN